MAENQVYLIKSGSNSFVEETEAVVGISGGKVGIGTTHPQAFFHVTGDTQIDGNLTVKGDLTTVNSTTIQVDDKNIELGVGSTSDTDADGGGITLHAGTNNNKTFNWIDDTDAWTSSEHLYLANGKHFSADELRALDGDGLKLADATTSGVLIKGGKVGIHKTAPVYDLDVDGSGNFSQGLYVNGQSVLTGSASDLGKWEDGTAGDIYYTGGNVGVGTNNPEYPFHVSGNAAVDGNFIVNGESGNLNVEELNLSGDYVHVNYLQESLSSDRGGLKVSHTGVTNSATLEYLSDTNHWQFNKKLEVLGDVDIQNNLTIGGLISNNASVESNFTVGNNLTVSGNFEVKGTTTTVNTQTVTIKDHNLVIASNTGYNQLTEEYPNAGGGYAGLFWGTGDAGEASPVSLTYQHNKGFNFTGAGVGISVENPAYDLDVAGTGNFSSAVQAPLILQNGNTVVDQGDIGSSPNQIPLNKDLGSLAYMNAPQIEDINVDTLELREIAAELSETAVDVFVYDTRKDSDGGAWRERTSHTSWYNEELNTATRGSRREFPAVAVIVAETNKVTIYDGDDPDLSMWMVFDSDYSVDTHLLRQGISSVYVKNGTFSVGHNGTSNNNRLTVFNFIKETSRVYYGVSVQDFSLNFSKRNQGTVGGLYKGIAGVDDIINRYVNDVAMTVLPNAPIDDDTGLPVPTIAVATDGGVSVIKDDGSVVDSSNTLDFNRVGFKENIVYATRGIVNIETWRFDSYGADGFIGEAYHVGSIPASLGGTNVHHSVNGDNLEMGSANGLGRIYENRTNLNEGMIAYTTSTYNTGWMPGDIKLATLSDTKIEKVGVDETTELITNNDFSSTINESDGVGWDLVSGTQSIDVEVLTIQPTTYGGVEQIINVLPNKKYIFNVVVHATTTGTARIYLGDSSSQGAYYNQPSLTVGAYNFEFTTSSDTVLKIKLATTSESGSNVSFSSTSLKQTGELITNGTFDNGTKGWEQSATAWSVVNREAANSTLAGHFDQEISCIAGNKYVVSFDITQNFADGQNGVYVRYGNGSSYVEKRVQDGSTGSFNITFVATEATHIIRLYRGVNSGTIAFDNISVRLAEDDRSVNDNGLQVFGEIDKTPVATGADLVAYSGFSANNYLMQPYHSDLDFGTGDFSIMGWVNNSSSTNSYQTYISIGKYDDTKRFFIDNNTGGLVRFFVKDDSSGVNSFNAETSCSVNSWNKFAMMRRSGIFEFYVNGLLIESNNTGANFNFNSEDGVLFGARHDTSAIADDSSLALWRISATAPTPEQIAKIYRDEKPLFQDGAQATLYGTSDSVTALAYDDSDNLLHVGTASGRSVFNGLKRVDNTDVAVTTAISAKKGFVIAQ